MLPNPVNSASVGKPVVIRTARGTKRADGTGYATLTEYLIGDDVEVTFLYSATLQRAVSQAPNRNSLNVRVGAGNGAGR